MMKAIRNIAAAALLLALPVVSAAEESSLSENEVPSLTEADLFATLKKEDCIIMYYTSDKSEGDAEARRTYGMSGLRLADEWMRALLAFQRQEALSLKLYKVNWKGMSPEAVGRIRAHTGPLDQAPESPSFVSYIDGGTGIFAIPGPARPDRLSWFVNEMLSHSIAIVKTTKGEFMRGPGWLFTDTKAKYINLVGVRKGPLPGKGPEEEMQIVDYESALFNGYRCSYESFYSRSGAMIGIVETCGKSGKVGYFDLDRTGRMQYRIRFSVGGATSATQPALPAK